MKRNFNSISRRDAEFAEKGDIFVTSIVRLPDPAHTSCPCRAKVKFYPQGVQVCRYELFSHTGNKISSLSELCVLERVPQNAGRVGEREKI